MIRSLYALYDNEEVKKTNSSLCGVIEVNNESAARELNKNGFGIFWSVNEFDGRRKIKNLKKINSWYCETDAGSKDVLRERINEGLIPSLIIESKRGYHIYWNAEDAVIENYEQIQERLIAFFGADKGVKDLARILRAPGYMHLKNPSDPFLIKEVFRSDFVYKEKSMRYFFKVDEKVEQEIKQKQFVRDALKGHGGLTVWSYFIDLNCEMALSRISGSAVVSGEVYTFRVGSNNTKQIYVNGKRSQCWIDASGKIGSHSKGGPGVFNWIKWFGYDNRDVVSALKQFFPEGFKDGN